MEKFTRSTASTASQILLKVPSAMAPLSALTCTAPAQRNSPTVVLSTRPTRISADKTLSMEALV